MKKCLFALIAIALSVACAKERDINSVEDKAVENNAENIASAGEPITISATLPEDLLTKVTFDPTIPSDKPTGMALSWKEGDQVRVYNHANHSQYEDFTLDPSCDGQKKGIFNGTAISAASYDIEVINPDLIVGTQEQAADGDTGHLKYYASVEDVASYDSIVFTDISSVLALTVKMPSSAIAATITSVDITASEDIFGTGNTLAITLTTPGDAGDDDILHLYANLPQETTAIPAGTSLVIHLNSNQAAHSVYTRYIELEAGSFTAGKLNTINVNATESATHAGKTSSDGTSAEKAYLIGDKYQMLAMRSEMPTNSVTYFKLIDDIDLDNVDWEPLNYSDSFTRGIYLDGQNHTVSNFSVYGSDADPGHTGYAYPSFAGVLNGTIKDITFDGVLVNAAYNKAGTIGGYIGTTGIVGHCDGVTVKNAELSSSREVGIFAGQVGHASCTFNECKVEGTNIVTQIKAGNNTIPTGGFVGFDHAGATYTTCSVVGTVKQADSGSSITAVGGFVGQVDAGTPSFTDCDVLSGTTVIGYDAVGGFAGQVSAPTTFTSVTSSANVSGRNFIGGLIGRESNASGTISITKSSFTNDDEGVSGAQYVGGLLGNKYGAGTITIENCYANSEIVASNSWAGGISANHYNGTMTIGKCYVMGSISALYGAGGIVGQVRVANLTIDPCAVYVDAISATATGSDEHESSGTIVAYGNNVNVTIARNCWYPQQLGFTECGGNAGNPASWPPARQNGLSNAKISGGSPHAKIYPYWGRYTNISDYPLNKMLKDILECSGDIWNLDVNPPTLK